MVMPKRATAKEVADLAGVSRTTVSFVLNEVSGMRISEETRQRVLEAARQLNYHPDATARRMVSGQTRVIGFVLRQDPDQAFSDQFLPQVLSGLSQAAAAQGYHILFEPIPPDDHSGAYLPLVHERHVDGIILSGPRYDDSELLKLAVEGEQVVLLGQLPGTGIPFVDVDNLGGAVTATNHLIGLGHTHIGFISNAPPVYTASADRLAGYKVALQNAGLPFDTSLVRFGSFTIQSGYQAMVELLNAKTLPTAVFVASDTVALGSIQAIRHRGLRIPEDIALVGFDDIPLSAFVDPPLTTVRLPAYGLGWGAADLLIRLLNQEEISNPSELLETELIVRESCGQHRLETGHLSKGEESSE
jgi:LacI family transcriptional regulator